MGFTRAELERAFTDYCALRERAIASGDWAIWGNQFSDDARYVTGQSILIDGGRWMI